MRDLVAVVALFKKNNSHWSGTCLYSPEWVDKLYRGMRRHLSPSRELRFVVVTDQLRAKFEEPVELVPFIHKEHVGRWFCINEVFRPDMPFDRAVYMGLDTVICGSVDWLADIEDPLVFTESHPISKRAHRMGLYHEACNPIVLFHKAAVTHLWEKYMKHPQAIERQCRAPWSKGAGSEMVYWRTTDHPYTLLKPPEVVSFRKEFQRVADHSMVYFHGKSKPHRLPEGHELLTEWV